MYSQCFIFLLIIVSSANNQNQIATVLHIAAFFDFDHSLTNNGRYELQAAQVAIDEINDHQHDLFNGLYVLKLLPNNSRCDPIYAVDAFFYAIYRCSQLHFLVGTSCSNETKAIIEVANYYNLILFSHSTSFISQANHSYSTLVRLSVSDENYNEARVAFVKHNNWSHVAIIHQDSIEHCLMMAKLAKHLNESNINVILTQSASRRNLTSALENLREKKARIVFVNFDTSSRALFFCQVYRTFMKKLRDRYVWILTENDFHSWNFSSNDCTKDEIFDAANGHIIIDSSFKRKSSLINPNMTAHQLQEKLHLKSYPTRHTLHAYDSIWVIALLIRASMEQKIPINEFTYRSVDIKDSWLALIEQIYFHGISGPVSFRNQQRLAETIISQIQIDLNRHKVRTIAEYSHLSGLNVNCSKCQSLTWPNTIPVDTERNEVRRVVLEINEIILITIACMVGLAIAIFFLIFNIIHRHERYIKLSSPKLNNVMLIGAMHIHIAILLFGFDQWFLYHNVLGHACILRIFLFSGGFSLTFGSMFLKTLRVYRIFTSHDRPLLRSKLLKDYYLLFICYHIYSIDVIGIFLWQYFDPQFIEFTNGSTRRLNMDTLVIDEIYYCNSTYRQKVLPFFYFYKSLFLVIGGYLAIKTRHVHISALNDSKYIVWSIYIVLLTSLFTVIVMILIQNILTYVVLCFVVIIMTSVILCLIFLPKVLKLHRGNQEEILAKDLYMDHSRIRRFAVEIDYFERYRYAQLQNQELKTELVRINHALNNLQKRLGATPPTVAMTLLPIAVHLASAFLQKPDNLPMNHRPHYKPGVDIVVETKEESPVSVENQDATINSTSSSDNALHELNHLLLSSSSEPDLSIALQSVHDTRSWSLTSFDSHDKTITDTDRNLSLISVQITNDTESALYIRLSNELDVIEATLDSDLDRVG